MGPFRLHQSSLSSIEVAFSLFVVSKLLLPFFMPHAADYPPLTGWISAALQSILRVGQQTGHSARTSSPWLACTFGEASNSRMLRPLFASPIAQSLPTTHQARPNQGLQWARFLRGNLVAWLFSCKLNPMHWLSLKVFSSRIDHWLREGAWKL